MRIASCILAAIIMFASVPAFAQDWINYFDTAQRFSVNLPGEPTIEDTTVVSQRGATYPQRVYRANDGEGRYIVKVVDYAEALVSDVRGSVAWEAWKYRKDTLESGGEITFDAYAEIDQIEGHQLQITNADKSRTFLGIHLFARRLYILEATVPEGAPPPMLFQVSLQLLDENGERVRFEIDADGQRTLLDRPTLR